MQNENQLIKDILNGNKESFSVLMKNYHDEIYHYVYNLVGDFNNSDDVVQEIFIRVYNKLSSYNPQKAGFRTWLYRVSHNYTMSFLKNFNKIKQKEIMKNDHDKIISTIDIETETIKSDELNKVIEVIERILKPKAKKIIYLHYFSELTPKEISDVTKYPLQTIYKTIKVSIDRIRNEVV